MRLDDVTDRDVERAAGEAAFLAWFFLGMFVLTAAGYGWFRTIEWAIFAVGHLAVGLLMARASAGYERELERRRARRNLWRGR